MLGGAGLPILWAAIVVAAMAEAALQFASWAKIEDELGTREERDRYARCLESPRSIAAFCAFVRVAGTVAFVALVLEGAADTGAVLRRVLAACLVLLAAEAVARPVGRKWSAGVLLLLLPALSVLSRPLRCLDRAGRPGPGQEGKEPEPEVVEAAREEIRVAIEDGTAEGALHEEEKEMIEGILKFGDVDVTEIMTPRTEIECLEADTPLTDAIGSLAAFSHSRIPVYEGDLDHVVGIVYGKDLLTARGEQDEEAHTLRDVMREPFFVPETKTVSSLLQECQRQHVQIAVVLDEYGGVSGLVTVEDIMEEIVGEIEDEYDEEDHEDRIHVRSSGGVEVDGRVRIDEVNEQFELDIPASGDYDTVGGFVADLFGRMPATGDEMRHGGLLVRILQSDERRVHRVFFKRVVPSEND